MPERRKKVFGPNQIGNENYAMLVVCVVAQLITILITWPTWQVRTSLPPNLPWIESTPQIPVGAMLIVSLAFVLISPRRFGLAGHLILLAVAMGMDQFRCQPQILAIAFLMSACVWPAARRVCVWYLASLWFWAGMHKFLSPDWQGAISHRLLLQAGFDTQQLYWLFGLAVALSETILGVVAVVKPKLAVVGCVLLHVGISVFLLAIGWNYSVLPWNICMAIVGGWLFWKSDWDRPAAETKSLAWPKSFWEKMTIATLLIMPVGFYFGLVRHSFAHVLYSDNLPIGLITHREGVEPLECWEVLSFPFPNEQKAYRDYFMLTAKAGEKLHIHEPRIGLSSRFYVLEKHRVLRELNAEEFFRARDGAVTGFAQDNPRDMFDLERAGATMKKRSIDEMIYAIKFDPDKFTSDLLSLLDGLPNLEQIQLADCNVQDADLKQIVGLRKLMGIGLNRTPITDAGLAHLKGLPNLSIIEHQGTQITEQGLGEMLNRE